MLESYRITPALSKPAEVVKLLPARMNPLPDELFSSWLVRLAMAHGMKLHSFCVEVFGRNASIWNRDIDKSADESMIGVVAARTNTSSERVLQTTLGDYAGKIYETHNPHGNSAWIMPLRIYHRLRRRNGLQFCPFCLREDAEPYYRRKWRLSWTTVCEKHRIVLLDRCPGCFEPVVFHRQEMGNRNQPVAYSTTVCPSCETDWTSKASLAACAAADEQSVAFQKSLKETMATHRAEIPNFGSVHSILFFKGLKQIIRILSVCNRSVEFRTEISRRSGIEIEKKVKEMNFDFLPVERRHRVLQAAHWLIDHWADEFIEIAKATKTWSSVLLPQNGDVPFWYRSVVEENLKGETFGASKVEIRSALSFLEKSSENDGKFILPLDLKRFMQSRDVLNRKSPKFKIEIYERIRNYNRRVFAAECRNSSRSKTVLDERNSKRQIFVRNESLLNRSLENLRIEERLRWIKEYRKIKSFRIASKKLGVSSSVLRIWYRRFTEDGIPGLASRFRPPDTLGTRKIFRREEKWIVAYHEKGLNITETVRSLKKDYDFLVCRQTVRKVLSDYLKRPS